MTDTLATSTLGWTLGWTLIHLLWVGALVLVVAAGVRRLLAGEGARTRYAVAAGVLALCAALAPIVFALVEARASRAAGPAPAATTGAAPATVGALDPPATDAAVRAPGPAVDWLPAARAALPSAWALGALLLALWAAVGALVARRLVRRAEPVRRGPLARESARVARLLGLRRPVRVAISDDLVSPVVVGLARPVVLVPRALCEPRWERDLEFVLWHELAHVSRRDSLANTVQRAIECALFFLPVVWWASRWARLERERCCDAVVVARTGRPREYVRALLALAAPARPRAALLAMSKSPLVDRIATVLNQESHTMNVSVRRTVVTVALTGASLFAVSLRAQDPKPERPRCTATRPAPEYHRIGFTHADLFRSTSCADCHVAAQPLPVPVNSCLRCHTNPHTQTEQPRPPAPAADEPDAETRLRDRVRELEAAVKDLRTELLDLRAKRADRSGQRSSTDGRGRVGLMPNDAGAPPAPSVARGVVQRVDTGGLVTVGLAHPAAGTTLGLGTAFAVYDGTTYKGEIVVTAVDGDHALCRITRWVDGAEIGVGDRASTGLAKPRRTDRARQGASR